MKLNLPVKLKLFKHPLMVKSGIILGIVVVAISGFVFVFNLSYSQRIFPKTYIGGINLGGKTKEQAVLLLNQAASAAQDKSVNISFEEKKWQITATEIDLIYSPEKSAQLAWDSGRRGSFSKIVREQARSILKSNKYSAVFSYNKEKSDLFLTKISSEVNIAEKDASIRINNAKAEISPEVVGRKMDMAVNERKLITLFGVLTTSSQYLLVVNQMVPKVSQANAEEALLKTQKILSNNIELKTGKKNFTLKAEEVVGWLDYTPSKALTGYILNVKLNSDKVSNYVKWLASEIDQEPRDAKFEMKDGKAMAFQTSQNGFKLDQEEAVKLINKAVVASTSTVDLPVKVANPEVSESSAATYGITELVGEGTTSWRGSPKNRVHNLTLGSENISGMIIKPGEEFSTVKAIGPIDAAAGFLPELVIKNGTQVVPDIGGGLCQVSTTLFRAVLDAGLKITERTNHSFRVSYYEPPVGMDATIYDPAPDFKFINNMNSPILIWAVPSDNGLTFKIYGTKDGRSSEVSDPVTFNYVDPSGPIYTETDTMEAGAIRQVERATRGVTASFHYKVTSKSGEILQDQTFVSKYIPVPDTFLYGPGTQIPPQG